MHEASWAHNMLHATISVPSLPELNVLVVHIERAGQPTIYM